MTPEIDYDINLLWIKILGGILMKNRVLGIVLGAASNVPVNDTSWITIVIIGAIAAIVLYFLYKNPMKNKAEEIAQEEAEQKKEEAERIEEEKNKPVTEAKNQTNAEGVVKIEPKEEQLVIENMAMPIAGRLMPITEVPDPVFSQKMMGDGFAIEPKEGRVFSPVNGRVKSVFPTRHAVALESSVGHEILIHFGIDTVSLNGEGFEACVAEGQEVKEGDLLLKVNLEEVISKGKSTITMVVFVNLEKDEQVIIREVGQVEAGMKDLVMVTLLN